MAAFSKGDRVEVVDVEGMPHETTNPILHRTGIVLSCSNDRVANAGPKSYKAGIVTVQFDDNEKNQICLFTWRVRKIDTLPSPPRYPANYKIITDTGQLEFGFKYKAIGKQRRNT
jgi:vacuolar-type H+-ATPase catalytic subunit A/Vma1